MSDPIRLPVIRRGDDHPNNTPAAPPAQPWPPEGSDDAEILWQDLPHDRRARVPTETRIEADSPHASYRLDRQSKSIFVECPCGMSRFLDRDEMMQQVGGDMNVIRLARNMINCGATHKVTNTCRAVVRR